MTGAGWIWYNGDFELYHSIKMHNRREEFDCPVPPFCRRPTRTPASAKPSTRTGRTASG